MEQEEFFAFAGPETENANTVKPFQVYVVDDDEGVIKTTKDAFEYFTFNDVPVKLTCFNSATSTIEALKNVDPSNPEVAVIFLDIVMQDMGFDVINFLREQSNNHITQIIVRTGQAGKQIQEEHLITQKYLINDFIDKSESSFKRIRTSLTTGIRMFQALKTLTMTRQDYISELEQMLHYTSHSVRKPMSSCLGLLQLIDPQNPAKNGLEELSFVLSGIKGNMNDLSAFTHELTDFMHSLKLRHMEMNSTENPIPVLHSIFSDSADQQ
jgi:CheY-like chemotaxis protein